MFRVASRLAASLALVAGSGASALTIDNFEVGDFQVRDELNGGNLYIEHGGLSPSDVVGGVRLVSVKAEGSGNIGFAEASLQTTPLDDGALVRALGPNTTGNLALVYDGVDDFRGSGFLGTLGLDLSGHTQVTIQTLGLALNGPTVSLRMFSGTGAFLATADQPLNVGGATSIDLSGFDALALADLRTIRFDILGLRTGDLLTLVDISAPDPLPIPEPGTGALVALGLTAFARSRAKSSSTFR